MVPPAKCIICSGTGLRDGRKFVDFGFNIDYYGALYFCQPCYADGIEKLGFFSPDQFNALHEKCTKILASYIVLEEDNAQYRNILDSVDFLAGRINSDIDNSIQDVQIEHVDDEKSSRQAAKSGSTDVPDNESDTAKSGDKSDFAIKI